ncbi:hypothetical protein BGW37DRAFT_470480 [Umbelopsis sp. PMI_123]|nr:hypothetical protein BGW37DRAFT_470480 [Umbelopsis sp. PMI_123]
MAPSFAEHEAELDASAIVWQQHFGLDELHHQDEVQWKERFKAEQWVKQVAPHLTLPTSRDARFLESLKRLKALYMERTATNCIIADFEAHQQLSYAKKEEQLKRQMDLLNIDKQQLLTDGRSAALAKMNMERMALELEKDNIQDHRLEIRDKCNQAQQTFEIMSRALSTLNERYDKLHKHEISNWKTEMALLDRKAEEYRNRAAALQEEYAERRLNEDGLVFHKLKEFQQEVENLEKVMQVKQQELAQFLDLPLDIKAAAGKLRSLYDTLDYLKRQRDELLQSIADSVR